eukprot:gene52268-63889_t
MFNTGRIVELNNQAKHSVVNHMHAGEYRTHLILDYLEPPSTHQSSYVPPPRPTPFFLPFGAKINQTRRSIDTPMEVQAYDVYTQQP